jgi:hypothetical protein
MEISHKYSIYLTIYNNNIVIKKLNKNTENMESIAVLKMRFVLLTNYIERQHRNWVDIAFLYSAHKSELKACLT